MWKDKFPPRPMSIVPSSSFFALASAHAPWLSFPTMPSPSDDESLSSSLPKSLRRHLYTAPQQPLDDPPLRPAPTDDPIPPLDRLPPPSAASLMDLAGAAVHQTAIPTQRPIYSDPVFHASRSSSLSRIMNPPSREGEPGPSTLDFSLRTSRDPDAWRQPKHEASLPPLSADRHTTWQSARNSWPELVDSRSPFSYHDAPGNDRFLPKHDLRKTPPPVDHRLESSFSATRPIDFQRRPGALSPLQAHSPASTYRKSYRFVFHD